MALAIWSAAASGSPTAVGIVWRLQTSRSRVDDEDGDLAAADVDADEQPARLAVGGRGAEVGERAGRRHRPRLRPSSRVISSADAPRTTTFSVEPAELDLACRRLSRPSERRRASSRTAASHGSPNAGDRPVEDDPADVEDADQARDRPAQEARRLERRLAGRRVAVEPRPDEVVQAQLALRRGLR